MKMGFYNRKHAVSASALFIFSCCFFSISVFGQNIPPPPDKTAPTTQNKITADENFELNITQDRITENNFSRSTKVELSNTNRGNLRVEVGVGVRADRIDATLRGIFGRVRFRASLESLRQRIEQLKTAPPSEKPIPPMP